MQFNVAHTSFSEQEEFKSTKTKGEEDDQDAMREISVAKFAKQIRRKEEVEGGKSGEKDHNRGDSVGKDRISQQPPKDSAPR